MDCERCGGPLAESGSVPAVAACTRCGKQRVGHERNTVPQCPSCFGDLVVAVGRLPITLQCPRERRFYCVDFDRRLLHPIADPYPLQPLAACPSCGAGLTFFEDLPPRATCGACDVDYSLEPLRAAPPCPYCGDQVRIIGEGAMPPQGDCVSCGQEAILADAPEPYAPPIEITVQAVLPVPMAEHALARRVVGAWPIVAVAAVVGLGALAVLLLGLL